uniref:Uncharacterized protein n=1 Tax=Romanomermis culicivorax TaxID=13658 RepID=A0A915KD82_ROMCU
MLNNQELWGRRHDRHYVHDRRVFVTAVVFMTAVGVHDCYVFMAPVIVMIAMFIEFCQYLAGHFMQEI